MKVATNALAIPSTVVTMKPPNSFGPGEMKRAMMPAMKPITTIQIRHDDLPVALVAHDLTDGA